jgi:predicted enzyme related to lactoylglutathione lyase
MGGRSFMSISVRYIVDSVEAALPFYEALGFEASMRPAPGFAALKKGDLRLLLNEPGAGGAGQGVGDRAPPPGGWNRFQLAVNDLEETVDGLRAKGVVFRNDIVVGKGGKQILAEDPAGNPVELF